MNARKHGSRFAYGLSLVLLLLTSGLAGQAAEDFGSDNVDHGTSPPTIGPDLQAIIDWAGPYRSYWREGGQPFAPPVPPLPPDVEKVYIRTRNGAEYSTSGTGWCFTSWKSTVVLLWFTDGSQWSYERIYHKMSCSSGSTTTFEKHYDVSDWGNGILHVRSTAEETTTAIISLASLESSDSPSISSL